MTFGLVCLISAALSAGRIQRRGSPLLLTSSAPSPGQQPLGLCTQQVPSVRGATREEGLGLPLAEWEGSGAGALTPLLPSAGCI